MTEKRAIKGITGLIAATYGTIAVNGITCQELPARNFMHRNLETVQRPVFSPLGAKFYP
jgi:ABC-type Fe3+/spermidine/putrescine transport system ATPase subunit